MSEKKKIVIDRDRWTHSNFMDEEGRSCAVGHILRSYGVTPEELKGRGVLFLDWTREQASRIPLHIMALDRQGTPKLTDRALRLVSLNDGYWGSKHVEGKLIEAALDLGVELEFVGEERP